MKVLLVGSGGREHALAWKLSQSAECAELHAAPGNPGIASLGHCHPVHAEDQEGLLALARELGIELVVVGPEAPLVRGLADELRHSGIATLGPGREAARIEGSKSFAKEVMLRTGVPTARRLAEARAPCVVKADGLAAGKGVYVCRTQAEADAAVTEAAGRGGGILVEELLEGEEVSLLALCDGATAVALPPAQDFKRALDGDRGPNTGGMGAFSPVPGLDASRIDELVSTIHDVVLAELAARGAPFLGVLFAGLMQTTEGPRVLEFNARFGDPEAQTLLLRLEGDLLPVLWRAATGELGADGLEVSTGAAVTVVLASERYPRAGDSGTPIEGIPQAEATGALVFHAGTALRQGDLVTNGGRILGVTGRGATLAEARTRAYAGVEQISFAGGRCRGDIALEAAGAEHDVDG